MRRPADTYLIELVMACGCCGDEFADVRERGGSIVEWPNGTVRCDRHHDRNACAIEGCKRSASTKAQPRNDLHMCGEHWRLYCPPHSARRRAYLAFFRKAKRYGWSDQLERQFWRFWGTLVANARRKATGGSIDVAAINRLMGWDDHRPEAGL